MYYIHILLIQVLENSESSLQHLRILRHYLESVHSGWQPDFDLMVLLTSPHPTFLPYLPLLHQTGEPQGFRTAYLQSGVLYLYLSFLVFPDFQDIAQDPLSFLQFLPFHDMNILGSVTQLNCLHVCLLSSHLDCNPLQLKEGKSALFKNSVQHHAVHIVAVQLTLEG